MIRLVGAPALVFAALLLLGSATPPGRHAAPAPTAALAAIPAPAAPLTLVPAPAPEPPPPPPPPTPEEALADGVLIVVSLASQTAFVFADGQNWDQTPVSTGRPGHDTPAGIFPILQKKVHHRSNLYDDAPMPYMQRLTWDGVALHAGRVPGYPASHGCIRLPKAFAQKLYDLTDFARTIVWVTEDALENADAARQLAGGSPLPAAAPELADEPKSLPLEAPADSGITQTIQLAATPSADGAAGLWLQLVARRPELAGLRHEIVPAVVNSQQVHRLRASGPAAHAICSRMTQAGMDCLKIPVGEAAPGET